MQNDENEYSFYRKNDGFYIPLDEEFTMIYDCFYFDYSWTVSVIFFNYGSYNKFYANICET